MGFMAISDDSGTGPDKPQEEGISQSGELVSIVLALAIITLTIKLVYRKSLRPPGPWGLPFIGHLHLLAGKNLFDVFKCFRERYGDVFGIRMGILSVVVISGKETIKKALSKTNEAFSDRPNFFTIQQIGGDKGIAFAKYNPRYILHRKLASNVLKSFTGAAKSPIQDIVQDESDALVAEFLNHKGKPFDPHDNLFFSVGSIIYQVCFGRGKGGRGDEDLKHFIENNKIFRKFVNAGNPFDVMPFLRYIMPSKFRDFMNIVESGIKIRAKKIKEHEDSFDPDHLRDATDGLIHSYKTLNQTDASNAGLTYDHFVNSTADFVGAGFDTTATTLRWALLFITDNPGIQNRIQQELDNQLGSKRPTMQDKPKLPFTEATILETLRMSGVGSLGLPRAAVRDIEFEGYFIPKGTVVFINLHGLSFDENEWEDMNEFKPERFLNKEGTAVDQSQADKLMSFSAGKRRCIGESLAKMEIFLFFANLLQKCTLRRPDGVTYDTKGRFALVNSPSAYDICVTERN